MTGLLRRAAPTALVATVFLVTVELLRAAPPLLDLAAGRVGVVGAAGLATLIFAAPLLVSGVVAAVGPARAALLAVAALVLLRLIAQLQSPATLLVVGAGAAVGIAALVLVVSGAAAGRSGVVATVGVLAGGVADLAIRAGLGSWDPIFRPGPLGWLITLAVCAAAVTALLAASPRPLAGPTGATDPAGFTDPDQPGRHPVVRVGVLGPYLALYALGYGSAPILAAHAGVSLPVASAVLIGGAVLSMEVVRRQTLVGGSGAIPEPDRWFAGTLGLVGLVGGVAVGYWAAGPVVLLAFAIAGLSAAVLLARTLTPRSAGSPAPKSEPAAGRRPVAYGLAGLAAGLGFVLPVMVYQVHYDLEFPFDNRFALLAVAMLAGLAGLGGRPPTPDRQRRRLLARPAALSLVAVAALLVPLAVAVTRPAVPEPAQVGASVRLMSWNVMYGRHHTRGEVDLESVARAVESVDPDILLLQEVSRGWPIGGGADLLEWLSRRLGMRYEWSPAADGQFGNALLTRQGLTDVTIARLPFEQGPMERSYLAATLPLASGEQLRIINTHLQHRKENTPTRLLQSEALRAEWAGSPRTIVAGDFNFWPSWEEPRHWAAAGFVSAQDVTGHGAEFTAPADDPDNRIDWIFGTPDLTFRDFEILSEVTNSDHLPLVVTVELS